MGGEVRAVIDVGTNSVKLLVAEVAGHTVRPLFEGSHQTRLGQGFYETGLLQQKAIDQTAKAVAEFSGKAAEWRPGRATVVATSAARDAKNRDDLVRALEECCDWPVVVISGEQEAIWAFRGVTSDAKLARQPLLVMDVGGGSTEFVLGEDGSREFQASFPLGSVRLLEKFAWGESPRASEREQCEREVRRVLEEQVRPSLGPKLEAKEGVQLAGSGGTSTILARIDLATNEFNREAIESVCLTRERIAEIKMRLWQLPLEERRKITGLPANRADVILPGVVIFDQVMEIFGFSVLRVSTRGIRFAALMDES